MDPSQSRLMLKAYFLAFPKSQEFEVIGSVNMNHLIYINKNANGYFDLLHFKCHSNGERQPVRFICFICFHDTHAVHFLTNPALIAANATTWSMTANASQGWCHCCFWNPVKWRLTKRIWRRGRSAADAENLHKIWSLKRDFYFSHRKQGQELFVRIS